MQGFNCSNTSKADLSTLDRINVGSTTLTDDLFNELLKRFNYVRKWVSDTDEYIRTHDLDRETFYPMWGEHTQKLVADGLFSGNRSIMERIRLVWWFSGWPINTYTDMNTFPVIDPTYIRYQKLKSITPQRFQYTAPALFGEAGWIEESGVVNHDVAILQERIQFLYFCGVADFLDSKKENMILELGSGYGGMSLAFLKGFPGSKNILCDIPQSLSVAFCYLNAVAPQAEHFAVTVDGVYHVNTGKVVSPDEAFNTPNSFVYLPNYLLPAYESFLKPTMVFNAMSLHEMFPQTIQYYCKTVSKLLKNQNGIFCEINTLPDVPNVAIDGRLSDTFKHCFEVDLPSLACRPRIWSNHAETIDNIVAVSHRMEQAHSLKKLFEFDCAVESPIVEDSVIRKMILDQLGQYLGPTASILPPEREPFMGNHLRYIVQRRMGVGAYLEPLKINSYNASSEPAELVQKIDELQTTVAKQNQILNEVYSSRSWRYTVILRKVVNLFRKLKMPVRVDTV